MVKSGRWQRLGKLTGGILKVAAKSAGQKVEESFKKGIGALSESELADKYLPEKSKAIVELVKTMGELKGAVMKLGQMLSITQEMFLPEEVTALFKSLQKSAPPMSIAEVEKIFLLNFNKLPLELFKSFGPEPIASASIGQVHLAELESGEKVAIKIQYPDILKAVKSDFKNLETLKKTLSLLFKDPPKVDHVIEELKKSILDECDYIKEMKNIEMFQGLITEEFSRIKIPKVYQEFTTTQILTMEYCKGDELEQACQYSQVDRDQLCDLLYRFHNYCFFEKGILHTDPQNGNYLFRRDGITLLDFGSIRTFSMEFRKKYVRLLRAIEENHLKNYRDELLGLGVFSPDDSDELFADHLKLARKIMEPFSTTRIKGLEDQNPFGLVKDFIQGISLSGRKAPREEFILLDRANIGIFTKMRALKGRIDLYSPVARGYHFVENAMDEQIKGNLNE